MEWRHARGKKMVSEVEERSNNRFISFSYRFCCANFSSIFPLTNHLWCSHHPYLLKNTFACMFYPLILIPSGIEPSVLSRGKGLDVFIRASLPRKSSILFLKSYFSLHIFINSSLYKRWTVFIKKHKHRNIWVILPAISRPERVSVSESSFFPLPTTSDSPLPFHFYPASHSINIVWFYKFVVLQVCVEG